MDESAENEMEAVRGIDLMGARNWSEDDKVDIFMAIFHPERKNDLKENAR